MHATLLWLIAGIALLLAEIHFGVQPVFLGLGALATCVSLYAGMVEPDAYLLQWLICFISTAIWAVLLWRPLQRWRLGRTHGHYSNMIGEIAYVGSAGLIKGMPGEATWSGTIMQAELAPGAPVERLEAGMPAIITGVKGATLIVMPKSQVS